MLTKILLVDDSRTFRKVMFKAFCIYPCLVFEAGNGEEGIQVAERVSPDLILLDLNMPVMDGEECLQKLKAHPALRDTPVMMLSANEDQSTVEKFLGLGAFDYLQKSLDTLQMIERARRVVPLTLMVSL